MNQVFALLTKKSVIKFFVFFLTTFFTVNSLCFADEASYSDHIFNWAETEFPEYFSPAGTASIDVQGYRARYYSETDTYAGSKDGEVYVYGQQFGGLSAVGSIEELLPETISEPDPNNLNRVYIFSPDNKADESGSNTGRFTVGRDSDGDLSYPLVVMFNLSGSAVNGEDYKKIFDVALDCRKNSKTFGKYFSIILSEKDNTSLFIPEGFAHGFCSLSNNTVLHYKCTNYRDEKSETGVLWNDKDLNIDWGTKNPINI